MDTTKTKGLFGRFTKNSRNKNIGDRKDIDNNMTSPAISTTLTSTPKTETPANRAALVDLITKAIAIGGVNVNLNYINTNAIKDMGSLFKDSAYTGDISEWDVRNVTNMNNMFNNAASFNGDISHWNVGAVTDMNHMFRDATSFNGDICSWDVRKVTDMNNMFRNAASFNGTLSWDISGVTSINQMFLMAESFEGKGIESWVINEDLSTMTNMFNGATVFNGDIGAWNVSKVTDMQGMFTTANAFNADISAWNVSSVITMAWMFQSATVFNRDISGWNVGVVTNMKNMFWGAAVFNQNLNPWGAPPGNLSTRSITFRKMFDGSPLAGDNSPVWYYPQG
ncbi:MAG: BspA family leucine-rich repeat surface protein [Psychromonas sp.]|nr:BspA family leucine-rich repeat surface protein [Psychromonas sp.]